MLEKWAEDLGNSSLSYYIQDSVLLFPILEVLHVMALALVVGTIFIVDLRLMNLCSRTYRVTRLMQTLLPITVATFVIAAITGFLMFASQPVRYMETPVFLVKMGLLSLAVVNMGVFHVWTQRGIAAWDHTEFVPNSARMAGLVSMVLWIGILIAGRFIGFLL